MKCQVHGDFRYEIRIKTEPVKNLINAQFQVLKIHFKIENYSFVLFFHSRRKVLRYSGSKFCDLCGKNIENCKTYGSERVNTAQIEKQILK